MPDFVSGSTRPLIIERPPNYESLTLTNSSAEFGAHSLTSPNDKPSIRTKQYKKEPITRHFPSLPSEKTTVNNTIIEDLKEEEISFIGANLQAGVLDPKSEQKSEDKIGPYWKAAGVYEPNPMDEDLPELTISNFNTKDSRKQAYD